MHARARRVFEVPELTELVFSFVEKQTLVQLLTVSQHFFYCAAPLVWKEVPEVMTLLCFLPGLDLTDFTAIRLKVS